MNTDSGHPLPDADGENRLGRFERLLRENVDATGVDWDAMEKALLERIRAAETEGSLIHLKVESVPPTRFLERLEADLFTRIQSHREYEEPVNEFIASPEDLSRSHWQRLEFKLEERIRAVDQFSPWECVLKADEELSPGSWETLEAGLNQRFEFHKGIPVWEQTLKADVLPTSGALESLEAGLSRHIASTHGQSAWELALKSEEILAEGRWEAMEEKLASRLDRQRKLNALATQPLWLSLGFYLNRGPVKIVASLVLVLAIGLGAFRFWQEALQPMDTLVYQAQGASVGDLDSALGPGRLALQPGRFDDVRTREDGALTMVNQRGYVDLRNGSRVKIERADRRAVHYRVAFTGQGREARGNATFFVRKSRKKQTFTVSTPDYRIEVLGTYFRVDPDVSGKASTAVLEGKVRIRSEAHGDFTLEAGQVLSFDPAIGRYRVHDGGRSVPREAIETVPGPEELGNFGILSVGSEAPQAEVRIDGHYRGLTPLVLLIPPGPHSLHLEKQGYVAQDTMISLAEGRTIRLSVQMTALTQPPPTPTREEPRKAPAIRAPSPKPKLAASTVPAAPSSEPLDAARLFHEADKAQARDWRVAVELYSKVLEHPSATVMRKEAALFSIAQLRADHEADKRRAKEDFLRYLALYPDGSFAGESWMRLAELEVGRNPDKAIEYYQRCIAKFPRHHRLSELQHRLGLLYVQNRRYDEAVVMFRRSLSNVLYNGETERRQIYSSLYRALVAKGDNEGAALIRKQYQGADSAGIR
ncbi:MAG TPA: PEGA domain-containing protein [Fibrobacteria bacterium]|nr:PEGA domain-containing protein [Fibrobacteria bacterium]